MRPALHHHQDLPSVMILMFLLVFLTDLRRLRHLLDRQTHLDYHQDCLPAPPPAGGRERARAENAPRERSRPRSQSPEPPLKPIPMNDEDDDQSPQDGDNDNGPDCVIVCILAHKHHKRHRYQRHKRRRYQCHKRHRYHQYNQWLSKSRLQYLMKTLAAPEDDKDPDRENEHLYMYRYIPIMSQQLWNHKVA